MCEMLKLTLEALCAGIYLSHKDSETELTNSPARKGLVPVSIESKDMFCTIAWTLLLEGPLHIIKVCIQEQVCSAID